MNDPTSKIVQSICKSLDVPHVHKMKELSKAHFDNIELYPQLFFCNSLSNRVFVAEKLLEEEGMGEALKETSLVSMIDPLFDELDCQNIDGTQRKEISFNAMKGLAISDMATQLTITDLLHLRKINDKEVVETIRKISAELVEITMAIGVEVGELLENGQIDLSSVKPQPPTHTEEQINQIIEATTSHSSYPYKKTPENRQLLISAHLSVLIKQCGATTLEKWFSMLFPKLPEEAMALLSSRYLQAYFQAFKSVDYETLYASLKLAVDPIHEKRVNLAAQQAADPKNPIRMGLELLKALNRICPNKKIAEELVRYQRTYEMM